MRLQRIAGLALLTAAAAAFTLTSRTLALPVAVCALAALGVSGRIAVKLPVRPALAGVLLALVFLAIQRISPFSDPAVRQFLFYGAAYSLGQFFLTWMAIQFLIRQPNGLPASLPLYAVGVMVCAGDVLLTTARQEYHYQLLAVAIAALSAAFFACSRRACPSASRAAAAPGRLALLLLTGLLCMAASWIGIDQTRRHEKDLSLLFEQMVRLRNQITDIGFDAGSQVGFSQEAQLQSVNRIKKSPDTEVMLRVFSQAQPGYLRAVVYDTYAGSQWKTTAASWTASPTPAGGIELDGPGQLFVLAQPPTEQSSRKLDIWPSPKVAGPMFVPLGTGAIRAATNELNINEHQAAASPQLTGGLNYRAIAPAAAEHETTLAALGSPAAHVGDDLRARCLQLPPAVDERVVALARELFAGCDSPAARIAAVERYFHDHYEYSLNLTVPPGQDPLTYFLLNKPPAHCEFFASGAAVLLRLGGVPARYVTGFVAAGRNDRGDYWLATSNDAHAWVEAWDDGPPAGPMAGKGGHWVIVEATPAAGVPQPSSSAWAEGLWDFIRFRFLQLRVAFELEGFKGLLAWLGQRLVGLLRLLATTAPGLALLAAGTGLAIWRLWRRKRSRRARLSPQVLQWRRLLARMDRRTRRLGLVRRESETLHQFAARIRQAIPPAQAETLAAWYEDYAATRYGAIDATTS